MNIQVNENYRITSDSLNVIVNRKHIVDPTKSPRWEKLKAEGASAEPRIVWKEVSYHSTVDKALTWLLDQQIRDSAAETVEDLFIDIARFRQEIRDVLAG